MHEERQAALTEKVCGSDREAVYNSAVLASKWPNPRRCQAGNSERSCMGSAGGSETARDEARPEAETKSQALAITTLSNTNFNTSIPGIIAVSSSLMGTSTQQIHPCLKSKT